MTPFTIRVVLNKVVNLPPLTHAFCSPSPKAQPPTTTSKFLGLHSTTYSDTAPPTPNSYGLQTPDESSQQAKFNSRKDSWPSLTDALNGKRVMLSTGPSASTKGQLTDATNQYSPLRGDAKFFTPRPYAHQQPLTLGLTRMQDTPQDRRDSVGCGMPMPRTQTLSVAPVESTPVKGSRQGIEARVSQDDTLYHLLPAFSPFDDDIVLPETRSEIAAKTLAPLPGLAPPGFASRPATSRAMFSPFFAINGEGKPRSLGPSCHTTASVASIWSNETTAQQSPFSPSAALSDTTSHSHGDRPGQSGLVSPFDSMRIENKTPNGFSPQGLWDESPVKQVSKPPQPSYRYAENAPSLFRSDAPAATIGASESYAPSITSGSTTEFLTDDSPKFEPPTETSATGSSRPGLPLVGSIAGLAEYSNDLLSIKKIEEKMNSLREQSSGLAGELIQQAAK